MDLNTYIQNAVATSRAGTFAESDQLTLGEITSKCEAILAKGYKCPDGSEPNVVFDFEYIVPVGIDSWRGSYDELSISFAAEGSDMPLSKFIEILKEADGKEYTGYKGGEYIMSRRTPVWVANHSNSGNTAVIEVVDDDYEVILITARREF